jgi:hypothetical protein
VREQSGQKQEQWLEKSAHSDLMLTSLADGATRCIRHGISTDTTMVEGNAGVCWFEPAVFPHQPTIFYARAYDGAVYAQGTLDGHRTLNHYVEFKNRLYWVNPFTVTSAPMSSNLDGTDLREVRDPGNNYVLSSQICTIYQGNLYFEVFEGSENDKNRSLAFPKLCRFHPERTDPIEILRSVPLGGSYQFDGKYIYFIQGHHNVWSVLTHYNNAASSPPTLCRVLLTQ